MKPRTEQFADYWDEPPKSKKWYKTGNFKGYYRKKFYNKLFKNLNKE